MAMQAKVVILLRGAPGAGKTQWVKDNATGATVCSADAHFERSGRYVFNPAELGEAHGQCLRRFAGAMSEYSGLSTIVVDNTNTSAIELAPYVALAQAHGAELRIVQVDAPFSICAGYQTHGVPASGMLALYAALATETLPPWWPAVEHVSGMGNRSLYRGANCDHFWSGLGSELEAECHARAVAAGTAEKGGLSGATRADWERFRPMLDVALASVSEDYRNEALYLTGHGWAEGRHFREEGLRAKAQWDERLAAMSEEEREDFERACERSEPHE